MGITLDELLQRKCRCTACQSSKLSFLPSDPHPVLPPDEDMSDAQLDGRRDYVLNHICICSSWWTSGLLDGIAYFVNN